MMSEIQVAIHGVTYSVSVCVRLTVASDFMCDGRRVCN